MNATAIKTESAGGFTFGQIMSHRSKWMLISSQVFGALILAGIIYLYSSNPVHAFEFGEIGLTAWGGVTALALRKQQGAPFALALVGTQLPFFLFPLLGDNPSLAAYAPETLALACHSVTLYYFLVFAGTLVGAGFVAPFASRLDFNLNHPRGLASGFNLAIFCLAVNLAISLSAQTNIMWMFISGSFFPVIRSIADVACLAGAFLGGFLIYQKGIPRSLKIAYFTLLWLIFAVDMAYLLLFTVVAIIAAYTLGALLGGGRLPWKLLLAIFIILGVLNFGKFQMREKYWGEGGSGGASFLQLPAFYLEWVNESLRLAGLSTVGTKNVTVVSEDEKGQSAFERVDSMDSMLFITDIMRRHAIAPLNGATYTLIPPLLIPRFLWPDKPIAHGGQVMLNIYFGRQKTVEETEKTFIAWGWLPEGIGNFGLWGGTIFIGLISGLICGMLEKISCGIRLLSVEGLVLAIVLIQVASSYATAASIFTTTTFQEICSVTTGGYFMYLYLGAKAGSSRPGKRLPSRRPVKLKPASPAA